MRLPPSTIVLAVATCIPFGLAIRDTLAGTYDVPDQLAEPDDEELDDDELRELELRRMAEQEAFYREQQEAEKRERADALRGLYGDEVAAPGTLFTTELGAAVPSPDLDSPRGMSLASRNDGVTVHSLAAKIFSRPDGECEKLQAHLRVAWGEPKSLDNRWIWSNGKLDQRAVWNLEDCELVFEKQLPLERWVAELPLQLLRKPVEDLHVQLGTRVITSLSADHSQWAMLGFGTGYGVVEMSTDNVDGRVVAIVASMHANPPTQTLLVDAITKLVGRPPEIHGNRAEHQIWSATRTTPRFELTDGTLIMGVRAK